MSLKITFQKPSVTKTLCLGVFEDNGFPSPTQVWDKTLKGLLTQSLENSKFKGKLNQILTLFSPDGMRIVLVGLGKKTDQNEKQWQKIGGSLVGALDSSLNGEGAVEIHGLEGSDTSKAVANIAYGILLKSWRFEKYFTKKKPEELLSLKKITFLTPTPDDAEKTFDTLKKIAEGVFLTRTVVTEPPNVMTPATLSKVAVSLEKDGIKVEVLEAKELQKLGMNALLGVAQGSDKEAKVVVMRWEGGKKGEAPLAFLGKGVTFDSGGLSLKPAANMEDMKYDMAGAGVVIGFMKAIALKKPKMNVVGVVGLVENMPSGTAQRPGDVVTSLSGQTIEILNTDAEGRLVLGDILWYTQDRFKPKFMVNLATLTGAIVVGLGGERAGLFSTDDKLAKQLTEAGEKVNELLWRMPLDDAYDKDIDSTIADMKNVGSGRGGGAITAAKFLQRFTNKVPWAHLDIAGVTWADKDQSLCVKGATGFGVRLLDRFVEDSVQ
jgi:leucyl aminopeptidase